ncbi:MAG TPA: zinc ribbon domain-containing protein [Polyangiales bacterium]|nr:zinc ribbon domain-containing protein [Polyangiales bacterium]
MPNLLPIVFIVLAATALALTLLWLWQSLRHAFVHTLGAPKASDVVSPERAALLAEKRTLLLALKDLEAERDSGKLSGDDYQELNEQYRKRAREVLRELDGLIGPHRGLAKQLLAAAATKPAAAEPAPPPVAAAAAAAAAASCASCGMNNDTDAVFCKKCGTRLRTEAMV